MSKPLEKLSTVLTVRNACYLSLAAASMLVGCVATVRVPGPPPPPVYVAPPPPPPPPAAAVEVEAPAVEVQVQASEPPPPLPDYEQPPCPEDGFLWTPGLLGQLSAGYYWIPGTWVQPPSIGVLWTPGYWGFVGGVYAFNAGYWGPHIGFYGGVNYGFGYGGVGFGGGRWVGNSFSYNTAVVRVNTTVIHNTYVNNTVVNNTTVNKTSFNGGAGGVKAVPTAQEKVAAAETHVPPTPAQTQHVHEALRNPQLSAKSNGGHPAIAATARPAAFSGPGVVGAKGAPPLKPVVPPSRNTAPIQHSTTPPAKAPVTAPPHPLTTAPKAPVNNSVHAPTQPPKPAFKAATPPARPAVTAPRGCARA